MRKPLYSILLSMLLGACSIDNTEQKTGSESGNNADLRQSSDAKVQPNGEETIIFEDVQSSLAGKEEGSTFEQQTKESNRSQDYTYQFNTATKEDAYHSTETDAYGSVKELLSSLATPAQTFEILPDEETTLVGDKGTSITITPNSFVFEDGTEPIGPITFSLKECYEYDDMLFENLTTTSQGKLLETGGMINLSCSSDGRKLKLKEFTELVVQFPQALEEDMHIFYGNREPNGQIDWEIDELARNPYPLIVYYHGKYAVGSFFSNTYKLAKSDMLALSNKYWKYEITFDSKGRETGRKFEPVNRQSHAQQNANKKFYELIASPQFASLDLKYPSRKTEFGFKMMDNEQFFDEKVQRELQMALGSGIALRSTKQRPRLFIGGLGWINIDAYLTPRLPDKDIPVTNILVEANYGETEYRLAFKNRKCLIYGKLTGGDYRFENVPIGEDVVVIGTYTKGETVYLGTRDVKVRKGFMDININMEYQAFTDLNAFKQAIAAL